MKKRYLILATAAAQLPGVVIAETKGKTGYITMRGRIGSDAINTDKISAIVDDFLAKDVSSTVVNLSSPGGSVFEANDIVAELERLPNVSIKVGALCASAATRFLTAFKSEGRSNSQFMIHKPKMPTGGNETEIEADLAMLKNATADYRKAYATKMGKTEPEIEQMWASGDKWMTATEAKAAGLIDKISGTAVPIDAEASEMLVACGAPVTKATVTPKTEKKYMEKDELIASLGLDATATDELIAQAIKDMKAKAKLHDSTKADRENELKLTAEKDVDAAIASKKILATQKDNYVKMYMAAPAETKAALEAMPEGKQLSAELDKSKDKDAEAARKDWNLETYLDKDPEALAAMEKSDPERFKKLNADYFKSK